MFCKFVSIPSQAGPKGFPKVLSFLIRPFGHACARTKYDESCDGLLGPDGAISFKTVNASKNFDFKNIIKNIKELGEIKRVGSSPQYGREFKINEVQLDILIPKDYNIKVLNEIKKAAKNENVKVNIIRG